MSGGDELLEQLCESTGMPMDLARLCVQMLVDSSTCVSALRSSGMHTLQRLLGHMNGELFAGVLSSVRPALGEFTLEELSGLLGVLEHFLNTKQEQEDLEACASTARDATVQALTAIAAAPRGGAQARAARQLFDHVRRLREIFVRICSESDQDGLICYAVAWLNAFVCLTTPELPNTEIPREYQTLKIHSRDSVLSREALSQEHKHCFAGLRSIITNTAVKNNTALSLVNALTGLAYYRNTVWADVAAFLIDAQKRLQTQGNSIAEAWLEPETRESLKSALSILRGQDGLPPEVRRQIDNATAAENRKRSRSRSQDTEPEAGPSGKLPRTEDEEVDDQGRPVYNLGLPGGLKLALPEIKDWILKSIAMIDRAGDTMQVLHEQGLLKAMTNAARKEQERELKAAAAEGIREDVEEGEVCAADLLAHAEVRHGAACKGRDAIEGLGEKRPESEQLLQAVFFSALHGAVSLSAEGAAAKKHGCALVSRLFTQMDEGSALLQNARRELVSLAGENIKRGIDLLLQMLYAQYASLAPFGRADLRKQDLEPPPDEEIQFGDPLHWLGSPGPQDSGFAFADQKDTADEPVTRYSKLYVAIIQDLRNSLCTESAVGEPYLAELLVGAPSIPLPVWQEINTLFCGSEDATKVCQGLRALATVAQQRPACANRAVACLIHHATGTKELARNAAVNLLMGQVIPNAPDMREVCIEFAKRQLDYCMDLPESAGELGDEALDTAVLVALSFYFALAAQVRRLFTHLFEHIGKCSHKPRVQRTILRHRDLTRLLRLLGAQANSAETCKQLAHFPPGSENLALRVLRQLVRDAKVALVKAHRTTKAAAIDRNLFILKGAGMDLYNSRGDVRFLALVLSLQPTSRIRNTLMPEIMGKSANPGQVQVAIDEACTPLPPGMLSSEVWQREALGIAPSDMLVYLHQLAPGKKGTPGEKLTLANIVDAIDACILRLPALFTAQLLTKALPQLMALKPLPMQVMRTALLAVDAHPQLLHFVLRTCLPPLRLREVWKSAKLSHQVLWKGVALLLTKHQPQTYEALLSLPEEAVALLCEPPQGGQLAHRLQRHLAQCRLRHLHVPLLRRLSAAAAEARAQRAEPKAAPDGVAKPRRVPRGSRASRRK